MSDRIPCPLNLEHFPAICSAGTCTTCEEIREFNRNPRSRFPPPGSLPAAKMGCLCDKIANNYGNGASVSDKGITFVYNNDCPLHTPR